MEGVVLCANYFQQIKKSPENLEIFNHIYVFVCFFYVYKTSWCISLNHHG